MTQTIRASLFSLLLGVILGFSAPLHAQAVANKGGTAMNLKTFEAISQLPILEAFPGQLSEGGQADDVYERPPLAAATPLSEAASDALLQGLEPLPTESQAEGFVLRASSTPPPQTGSVVQDSFPAAAELTAPTPPDLKETALQVLRYAPEGEVPISGQISITFNQPMVAVNTQEGAIAESVPARISPDIPGQWRWLGTRTLIFEPAAERLPMATQFTVDVPAGVKSAAGKALSASVVWQFNTPPVQLLQSYPAGTGVDLQPVLLMIFNQRIDPEKLLPFIQLQAGKQTVGLRLASQEELAANKTLLARTQEAKAAYWLALRPEQALPVNTSIKVAVLPKAPSAEGERLTEATQTYEFSTYGPLVIERTHCGWGNECRPASNFTVGMSNVIPETIDVAQFLSVSPALPDMEVEHSGNTIIIKGLKQARTDYTVTLSPELKDRFGQQLTGNTQVEFKVGSQEPAFIFSNANGFNDQFTTLDPFGQPQLSVFTNNYGSFKLTVHRMTDDISKGLPQYLDWLEASNSHIRRGNALKPLPGEPVVQQQRLVVQAELDKWAETRINLSPWLDENRGHLLVMLEAGDYLPGVETSDSQNSYDYPRRYVTWVQATQIGLDAYVDNQHLLAWSSRLKDGAPLAGVAIKLNRVMEDNEGNSSAIQTTDANGLAKLALLDKSPSLTWLEATQGKDSAILLDSIYSYGSTWSARGASENFLWYVVDDRQMYRPNEEVHIKGWVRKQELIPSGDLAQPPANSTLTYELLDAQNNKLAEGEQALGQLGGFDLHFKLPDTPNLGTAQLVLKAKQAASSVDADNDYANYVHHFQIQEFRTPEFEVKASVAAGPFVGDQVVNASVAANYYAGGALPGAPVEWQVSAETSTYTPPNQSDWSFGFGLPEWFSYWRPFTGHDAVNASFSSKTNAEGQHHLAVSTKGSEFARPLSFTAQASVSDVNRQTWSASTRWLLHPADVYVGMKTARYFVEQGELLPVDLLTVDLEGKALGGRPLIVEAGRVQFKPGEDETLSDVQRCQVQTDAQGLAQCRFKTDKGGQYRITATTMDAEGRRNASRITRWVSGGGGDSLPTQEEVSLQTVQIIPDQDKYAPGDTAQLLLQAPFADAEGLLILGRNGFVEQQRFRMQGSSHTLSIPVKSEWLPNVQVQVTLLGQAPRSEVQAHETHVEPRPAIAVGRFNLPISLAERSLSLVVEPQVAKLSPGDETEVSIHVTDVAGRGVADAELALIVVDEAILALSDYQLPDPLVVFYPERSADIGTNHSRLGMVLNTNALKQKDMLRRFAVKAAAVDMAFRPMPRVMADESSAAYGAINEAAGAAISLRSDFNPLAAFVPSLMTDANGLAKASIQLPDNLTRYRIMVVAVEDAKRFGTGESSLIARLPLMVRPSAPRFLNFGDRFEFPVVLQNQTDESLEVQVAMRANNLGLAQRGFAVQVPANERVEVRFPANTLNAGKAHYQVVARSATYADAAQGELPVWTPATTETFATYGVIDQGAIRQPIASPKAVWPQFGALAIDTSSTAVQSLTDAFIYLREYPFECSEQIASRVMTTAALRDVLQAFAAEGLPDEQTLTASMQNDFKRLAARQKASGGFALWAQRQEVWPYVSVHVAHALIRASYKGYKVNQDMLQGSLKYIRTIEQHIPANYPPAIRQFIIAYSLYVRSLSNDFDRSRASKLLQAAGDPDKLPLEAVGWLLMVLSGDAQYEPQVVTLRQFLNNRVIETASTAHFASSISDGDYLVMHAKRRADGVILEALIKDQPKSDLIPKLVKGLQAHSRKGRWSNTQENAFILLALDQYFQTFENQTPDFVARSWLGQEFVGQHAFKGYSTETHKVEVPMDWLLQQGERSDLILDKDGAGRLYYRIGLRYAPEDLELAAANYGFEVKRTYKALDDASDVQQREDGVWVIKAGARVEVELQLFAPANRYHVALVDPLPAGLEAINPALVVNADSELDNDPQFAWWWGSWYEHQNLRDERAEAFTSLLRGGVYTYRYIARATTPGEFVVPPAKAEEMYQPETFGRSASAKVVVQAP